jgi:hypothetical protein
MRPAQRAARGRGMRGELDRTHAASLCKRAPPGPARPLQLGAPMQHPNLRRNVTMRKIVLAIAAAALLAAARTAVATPSTVVWTPATPYTQPFLVPHLTYDTYVAEKGFLQNDYGLTVGFLPDNLPIQGEGGFDFFLPTAPRNIGDFFQLNAKLTLPENKLGSWQPGVSAGIMNVGFKKDVSNYDLLHAEVGKTFFFGAISAGGYYGAGSKALWTGSDGVSRAGLMASYVSPDLVVNLPGLQKVNFAADISTGKNWFGAVGGGAVLYFTPAIDLITGPVWFLDGDYYKGAYGTDFMWTFQVDVDVDLMKKPAK